MGRVHGRVRMAGASALVLAPALALAGVIATPAAGATSAAGAATATSSATAAPAWRIAYQHHYGAAGNFSSYQDVTAIGKSDAWAVGTTNEDGSGNAAPVAVHWNGRKWAASALPAGLHGTLLAASASGPANVWAVSWLNQYALRWNGRKWAVAKRFTGGGELTGVTAISASDVWVFGAGGFEGGDGTWHDNGRTWTRFTGAAAGITRASALSARNIWGIGSLAAPQDALVRFNGTSWRRLTAPALAGKQFNGIDAVSAADVWVVGFGDGGPTPVPAVLNWTGTTWKSVKVPWAVQPDAVTGDGQGGIWVTATSGTPPTANWILHRSRSGAWTRTRIGAASVQVSALSRVPGSTAVWGAGTAATKTASSAAVYAHGAVG
jgi:hypothetical protein